jgi:hypothetical protein
MRTLSGMAGQANQSLLTINEKHEWMTFVREVVQRQAKQLPNLELARAWQMFADSLHTIHAGLGNWNGFVSMGDINTLVQVAASGLRFHRAYIGENLFWFEIGGDDELEVTLQNNSVHCSATQMRRELQKLLILLESNASAPSVRAS